MCLYHLAIDMGASSGRHMLGYLKDGKIILEEIYRFDNKQLMVDGHMCWDINWLISQIIEGLKACKKAGKIPASIAVDTWGVDYVLLDENDRILGQAVAYRDSRTAGEDDKLDKLIPPEELYAKTGIQKQMFNTIYQLMAQKREHPEHLEKAKSLLMLPDYINFLLTGNRLQEYTMATTTNLVNTKSKTWDFGIIDKLELPRKIFGELSMPGTLVGRLTHEMQETIGFDADVVLPATHDTGSAFLAVPAVDEDAVYISSGTWSLLGVENPEPITTLQSRQQNFTNEGGAFYRYRYLKNIMGLWMIQSIRRELNGTAYIAGQKSKYAGEKKYSFPDLIEEAKKAQDFSSIVNIDDEMFMAPESMIDAIKVYCRRTNQKLPQTVGELMQCAYLSLTKTYKQAIEDLSKLTGKTYTSINIVGGGCQDMYLNQMTADVTGLPVYAGPIEGTAIGNLIMQFIYSGEFTDLQQARDAIRESFDVKLIK